MATGAACYYHPAAGRASPSSLALGLRSSQSKVFFISSGGRSSSRWWMRRRGEGKASCGSTNSSSRARERPALFSPRAMEWQECSTEIEVDVPCSVAYQCYSERETIPQWMPFISTVKVLEDKPDLSRWTLKYAILGQDVEFSWLARNMTPTKNQKIHWRSLEGLPNRLAATCIAKRNTRNFINKFLQPANRSFTLKTKMNPEEIHAVCVATPSIFGGFAYKPNIENQAE